MSVREKLFVWIYRKVGSNDCHVSLEYPFTGDQDFNFAPIKVELAIAPPKPSKKGRVR